MYSFIKSCLLVALVVPALTVTGQPAGDSIPPVKPNELNINLQFMGRGESRYGGMMPEDEAASGEEEEEETDPKTPTSNFLLGRTRLEINYKRDWLEARVSIQECGDKPEREPSTCMRHGSRCRHPSACLPRWAG